MTYFVGEEVVTAFNTQRGGNHPTGKVGAHTSVRPRGGFLQFAGIPGDPDLLEATRRRFTRMQ